MSTNEVRSIQQIQQRRRQEQTTEIRQQNDEDIQVFGSDNVAARVSLVADENNSLFSQSAFLSLEASGTQATSEQTETPINELPEDVAKLYPGTEDQKALKTLTAEQLELARTLMDTKLSGTNIASIVKIFDAKQVEQIKKKVEEIQETAGGKDNVFQVSLGRDYYDQKGFDLRALSYDLTLYTENLDDKLERTSIEQLTENTTEDGKSYRIQEAFDLQNNTLSKIRYDYNDKYDTYQASYEIRTRLDENGNMVSRELTQPSNISGVFNTEVLTEDGTEVTTSAHRKKNGKTKVNKDMRSLDGTRTQYRYREDAEGNRSMRYKITDKDGNVLMDNRKSFKVVSENEFKSSFNGKNYTMTVKDGTLTVVNDNDPSETATFQYSDIQGNRDNLITVLQRMSGEELIAMSRTTQTQVGIDDILESYYQFDDKSLHSGEDMFVVLHELGHAKDFEKLDLTDEEKFNQTFSSLISQDKELQETFEKEKAAFNKAFPDAQREHIDYFINTLTHYSGATGGLQETTAEGNAIHSTPLTHELLGLRTQYLQQYFPRTLVRLNTLYAQERQVKQ